MNSSSKKNRHTKKFSIKTFSPTNLLSGGKTITLIVSYHLIRYLALCLARENLVPSMTKKYVLCSFKAMLVFIGNFRVKGGKSWDRPTN